jgi:hypothetical protein
MLGRSIERGLCVDGHDANLRAKHTSTRERYATYSLDADAQTWALLGQSVRLLAFV